MQSALARAVSVSHHRVNDWINNRNAGYVAAGYPAAKEVGAVRIFCTIELNSARFI